MQAPEFTVVYDILSENYFSISWFSFVWFGMVLVISIVFLAERWEKRFKVEELRDVLGLLVPIIMLPLGVLAVGGSLWTQYNCLQSAKNNDFQVAEGRISNLQTNSKRESFSVSGIGFEYREYDSACGYNQGKGTKLIENKLVRLSYKNGCILKMEVGRD